MALTPSTMLELGSAATPFNLLDPCTDKSVSLADYANKPVLVIFMCNHCPYVIRIMEGLANFGKEYGDKGLQVIAINSNDVENYPADSPEKMIELVSEQGFTFPYLVDESQEVALAYQAACTPDFYLFDGAHKLVYRGQFDGARPGNDVEVTGEDMRAACDALLSQQPQTTEQVPSLGCNIKWKAGNEPEYFG